MCQHLIRLLKLNATSVAVPLPTFPGGSGRFWHCRRSPMVMSEAAQYLPYLEFPLLPPSQLSTQRKESYSVATQGVKMVSWEIKQSHF